VAPKYRLDGIEAGLELIAMMNDDQTTILVVEDQPLMRRLIVEMLGWHGLLALEASTAVAGLEAVRKHGHLISLAIIDMVMPGISGLDLAAELNRCRPSLPILYISGYVASIAMEVIARRSPEAVLLKPFTESELIARVRRLVELAQAPKSPEVEPGFAMSASPYFPVARK
jgi:CheY-like chemotaxis protein